MNIKTKLKWKLKALLMPNSWLRIGWTDRKWDRTLLELIETDQIIAVGKYEARIGDYTVWIENYPWGSGTTTKGESRYKLPSRATALYLEYRLEQKRLIQLLTAPNYLFQKYGITDNENCPYDPTINPTY